MGGIQATFEHIVPKLRQLRAIDEFVDQHLRLVA
jgi:hypothetical protein